LRVEHPAANGEALSAVDLVSQDPDLLTVDVGLSLLDGPVRARVVDDDDLPIGAPFTQLRCRCREDPRYLVLFVEDRDDDR
jgi:hypothetical protein